MIVKRYRVWLVRLLIVVVATVGTIKVGDVAVGWLRNTRQRHLFRLPVHGSQHHRSTEFDYIFTANSLGLRGPERPFHKPPGARRIVVVGDSFVAGYGVVDDAIFTGKLELLLNSAGRPPVEVIGVARNGTSTIREYDLYTQIGRRFEPDIVLLAFFVGNDLVEVVEEHDRQELRQWHPQGAVRRAAYGLCPNLYLELAMLKVSAEARGGSAPWTEDETLAALRSQCESHGADFAAASAAYRKLPEEVKQSLAERLYRYHQVLTACYDPLRLRRALGADDAFFELAWPRVESHLDLLHAAVSADRAQLAVLIIPDATQVDPAAQQFATEIGFRVDPDWLTEHSHTQERIAAWCERTDIRCFDLTDDLRKSTQPLYYPKDGHLNAAGHQRTAELLAEFLKERIN